MKMNSDNAKLLFNAASTILESAKTMQKGPAKGKDAMKNFSRFSASVHSFQVYTFMDAAFETLQPLTDFKAAITTYEAHFVLLRNTIDVKVDQKAAGADFKHLENCLAELKTALNIA